MEDPGHKPLLYACLHQASDRPPAEMLECSLRMLKPNLILIMIIYDDNDMVAVTMTMTMVMIIIIIIILTIVMCVSVCL